MDSIVYVWTLNNCQQQLKKEIFFNVYQHAPSLIVGMGNQRQTSIEKNWQSHSLKECTQKMHSKAKAFSVYQQLLITTSTFKTFT